VLHSADMRALKLTDVRFSRDGLRVIALPEGIVRWAPTARQPLRRVVKRDCRRINALLARRYRAACHRAQRELAELTPLAGEHFPLTLAAVRKRAQRGLYLGHTYVLLWRGPKRVRDVGLGIGVCAGCFRVFNASMRNVRHCPRCTPPRQSRAKPHQPKPCAQCGEAFTPARADARTCSARCRVALHRTPEPPAQ
jgi:hypothetical protein